MFVCVHVLYVPVKSLDAPDDIIYMAKKKCEIPKYVMLYIFYMKVHDYISSKI